MLLIVSALILLSACGNSVEEIEDPKTGMLELRYEFYEGDSGQKIKDGQLTRWNPDGTVEIEQKYSDGLLEGEEVQYESSDYVIKSNYKKGQLHGEYSVIIDGKLRFKQSFKNDKLTGNQTWYDSDSNLSALGITGENGKTKEWKSFSSNGIQIAHFHFNSSGAAKELIGTWREKNTGDKEYYYKFFENGTFEYWAPVMKISSKGFKTRAGTYTFSDMMNFKSFRDKESYDVVAFTEHSLVLQTEYGEKEYEKK